MQQNNVRRSLKYELSEIDKELDRGIVYDTALLNRMELMRQLQDINQMEAKDSLQKSKIKWAIEGDENTKFFHGIINKKRSQLSIRGVFVDGNWCTDPSMVKDTFKNHFEARFKQPSYDRLKLNTSFNNWLSPDQVEDMDRNVSRDEFVGLFGTVERIMVEDFFDTGLLPKCCNSSFIALIPKVMDAKFVSDFRPISLIGYVYKVITKVLAIRLSTVISDLVSETQSAFVANRQILDGPFILNEVLNWCKRNRKQSLFFKVDFAKAYDSVRWDYLLDVLYAFGFGPNWCRWIRGDPLSPYLFILIMESLHISFFRVVNDGLFKGVQLHGSVNISHLFYADDAMFIGEWSDLTLKSIVNILKCFFLASGLKINIHKSQVLGIGVPHSIVGQAANMIGCVVMKSQFRYLGVMVGECMSQRSAWVDTVHKLQSRLSKWKVKTLSIGGRLTLLKSVLGASPLYNMSIYKVPKGVLKVMEIIRSKFFNGADSLDRKITWVAWDKVWRFISRDGSLWFKVIQALYGSRFPLFVSPSLNWPRMSPVADKFGEHSSQGYAGLSVGNVARMELSVNNGPICLL
ncbi:RNA-directed DNA polymerase, eukaryota [Tanacetum coccineum]|uniref:RNA-directed DNA polymerase, eukaryota n=1 Tax=Tanacetum coccineum TaxID=301880 RepID=A0ABQ5A384_9ASTR